jgi:transcriptional regulator with XRE-family HTH domain
MAGKGSGKRMPASEQDPRGIAVRHDNMKKALKAKHLSRHALAELMKVSDGTMDNWIDGDERPGRGIPNDKLAEMANLLSVSVWYLLDQTNRADGYGARPLEQHSKMARMAAIAKDSHKAARYYSYEEYTNFDDGRRVHVAGDGYGKSFVPAPVSDPLPDDSESWIIDSSGEELQAWKVVHSRDGHISFSVSVFDWREINADYEYARKSHIPDLPGWDEAQEGWKAYWEWFRQQKADSFRRDLLALRGDYRDPAAVIAAEAAHAAATANPARFDEIAQKMDSQLRGIMGTAATEQP